MSKQPKKRTNHRRNAQGGFPDVTELVRLVDERFRVPRGGGRATDPRWSDKRLIPVSPRTLTRLERIVQRLNEDTDLRLDPMQLGAILLETGADHIETLLGTRRRARSVK